MDAFDANWVPPFYMRRPFTLLGTVAALTFCWPALMAPLVGLVLLAISSPSLLGRRFFARVMRDTVPEYNEVCRPGKAEFFAPLRYGIDVKKPKSEKAAGPGRDSANTAEDTVLITSGDPKLQREGKFRLLELGAGPGANFEFFPSNCCYVASDLNAAMEPYFRSSLKRYEGRFTFERFILASATELVGVADESVDVIVTSMVLGYIEDFDALFREVLRVLTPGGKFYFWEHVLDPNTRSVVHAAQKLVAPLTYAFCDGVRVDTSIHEEFHSRRHLFGDLDIQHFTVYPFPHTSLVTKLFFWFLMGTKIRGVMTKKVNG